MILLNFNNLLEIGRDVLVRGKVVHKLVNALILCFQLLNDGFLCRAGRVCCS